MYKIYFKSSTTNENVNTNFISSVTLTSDSDITLNKRIAFQESVICALGVLSKTI